MPPTEPRLALRTTSDPAELDDVVVRDVAMFHAEVMRPDLLWMSCYLEGTGVDGDEVSFFVRVVDGRLQFEVDQRPTGSVTYESDGG